MSKVTLIKKNHSTKDTIQLMYKVAEMEKNSTTVQQLCKGLPANLLDALEVLNKRIDGMAVYQLDQKGYEQIRTPERLYIDKIGDCDCFSTTWMSCLKRLKIPAFFRVCQYKKGFDAHVYVIVPLTRGEAVLDTVYFKKYGLFNKEVTHVAYTDYK